MSTENLRKDLLKKVADIDGKISGAFNIRHDGEGVSRFSTPNVEIKPRKDGKQGIDVFVRAGTKNESVHIPVILTKGGFTEKVYNDFIIGEGANVNIIAGCAIHNCSKEKSQHDGIHTFYLGKNSSLTYSEKHYGEGEGKSERVLNPVTIVHMAKGAVCEMEMVQIEGVTSTNRKTTVYLEKDAKLNVVEKLLTHDEQTAVSDIDIYLNGENSSARIISRSVAKDNSVQEFKPVAIGNAACRAHIQCDSIIMANAKVRAVPAIEANHQQAQIVHEAAIGRINNEQLIKLETFGMEEEEAEQIIINAFLS